MAGLTYPLVAWGTVTNINAGSDFNTPVVTTGVTDPFGGTGAYTINDNDGALVEGKLIPVTLASASTSQTVHVNFWIKAGTATASDVRWRDGGGANPVVTWRFTWSGGVPTPSVSTGTGTVLAVVDCGNGWYFVRATATGASGAAGNQLFLMGATVTGATTGTTSYYVQSAVLLDLLGTPKAFSRPRAGYEASTSPSGTRDAWSYGVEEVLQARTSWIPTADRDTPVSVSGWYGTGEAPGVNAGVKTMLEAGWNATLLRYVPDRAACTSYVDAYLTSPGLSWVPELEGNADRAVAIELVSPSTVFGGL